MGLGFSLEIRQNGGLTHVSLDEKGGIKNGQTSRGLSLKWTNQSGKWTTQSGNYGGREWGKLLLNFN